MELKDLSVEQYMVWKHQGLTDKEILEKMYYSVSCQPLLSKWKKKNGVLCTLINRKAFTKKVTEALTVQKFLELRNKGLRLIDIAELYHVSMSTLTYWVRDQKKMGNLPNSRLSKNLQAK